MNKINKTLSEQNVAHLIAHTFQYSKLVILFSSMVKLLLCTVPLLVAWHSGRTSVSGRRTFPVLRLTCS